MLHSTSDLEIPDLSDPRTYASGVPHSAFDRIRQRPGLYWEPTPVGAANGGFWAVTRYADIVAIESDPATFSSRRGAAWPGTNTPVTPDCNPLYNNLMNMDPPRHGAVRRVVATSFRPRAVANMEPWIRGIVGEVLDWIERLDAFDYVVEVAAIVPSAVIARIMGVPYRDTVRIVEWMGSMFRLQQEGNVTKILGTLTQVITYIREELQPKKLRNPADDIATALFQSAERGELTHDEAYDFLNLLLAAGFQAAHALIGQAMRMTLDSEDVARKAIRGISELGPGKVVDEFLRCTTPAMNMARTVTRDTEIAGQVVRKGDLMQLYFTAANRDPAVFVNPHEFNPWRSERMSLAFGSGVHRCIGTALARLELGILFEETVKRGSRLRLNGEPRRGWSTFMNELTSLPVANVNRKAVSHCA